MAEPDPDALDGSDGAIDVVVNAGSFADVPVGLVEAAVRLALEESAIVSAEVSVTCLSDDDILSMNHEYLGKESVTDVISFSLGDERHVIGDVYLGYPQALRQAEEMKVDGREEVVRLAIHGTLHVLGHDHPDGPERAGSPMFALQEELLTRLMEQGEA